MGGNRYSQGRPSHVRGHGPLTDRRHLAPQRHPTLSVVGPYPARRRPQQRQAFQSIHYAIFLAHNVNILATSLHKAAKNGRPPPASVINAALPISQKLTFHLLYPTTRAGYQHAFESRLVKARPDTTAPVR
ncbi:hypothetical protein CN234_21670 [Sinorhizobium meliloti]|nr:hypothetical protein CN234_21670 [Sinorhizobium meliloti]